MTSGRLVLVGTPIGNLEDISARAIRALGEAHIICCEDTRRTRKLLSALGVPAPTLMRLDRHREAVLADEVVARVEQGATVALVSDAGMPTISDPGSLVVRAVSARGLAVETVPGPSAVSTALALSGFDAPQYRFAGFLPRKGRERAQAMASIVAETITVVVFESPHRVERTLDDLADACPADRPLVVARELTKLHEEVWRGRVGDARGWLAAKGEPPRGEWVLILSPAMAETIAETTDEAIRSALEARYVSGADRKTAISEVAVGLGVPKRRVYTLAVSPPGGETPR